MTSIIKVNNIQNSSGTSALTIDGSGNVSVPNNLSTPTRPAFSVRGYGSIKTGSVNGVTLHASAQIIYNWQSVIINRGSAFNNSTGIYTAPVAGLYQVHAGFGYKSSGNYLKLILFLTSSDDVNSGHISGWNLNDGQHYSLQLSTIVEASVGQEFALGMSDTYSNPHTDKWYLWFSAYLIG